MAVKRARGNKTSKVVRERRKQQIAASLGEGKGAEQTRRELGLSNGTFYRLISTMNLDYSNATMETLGPVKGKLMLELARRAEDVLDGKLDPKAATAWVKIINLISELGGMKISRSMNVHVSAEKDTLWLKFKKAVTGLTEPQIDEAIRYLAALPRTPKPVVRDASWFPAPEPALLEGGSDD
jgi:hypothetical protein